MLFSNILAIYYVTERCQDGWFKGTNRSLKSGVFPGNYVAPLRHSRESSSSHATSSNGSKRSSANSVSASGGSSSSGHKSAHKSKNSSSGQHSLAVLSSIQSPPPELPPRSGGSSCASSSSVWSKPLGQHVEAFFSRKSGGSQTVKVDASKDSSAQTNGSSCNSKKDHNTSTSAASTTVNLIKRFTNMKRSKSPVNMSSTAYSMDNPVFEDIVSSTTTSNGMSLTNGAAAAAPSKRNTIHLSHPVHVRSGSCPSQLLQSLPVDINLATTSSTKKTGEAFNTSASSSSSYMFGSQRVKGHKERPTLHGYVDYRF